MSSGGRSYVHIQSIADTVFAGPPRCSLAVHDCNAIPGRPLDTEPRLFRTGRSNPTVSMVQFRGNSLTDPAKTVEPYMLYRAAELTKQNGVRPFPRRCTGTDCQIAASCRPVGLFALLTTTSISTTGNTVRGRDTSTTLPPRAYPRSFYAFPAGAIRPSGTSAGVPPKLTSYVGVLPKIHHGQGPKTGLIRPIRRRPGDLHLGQARFSAPKS